MRSRWAHKRIKPSLNIAPLIDCVFLLLIFFVVTSTMSRHEAAVRLELPGSSSRQERPALAVTVEVPLQGPVLVNGAPVHPGRLSSAVAGAAAGNEDARVTIFTDRRTPVERVIAVMDEVRLAGVAGITLATVVRGEP